MYKIVHATYKENSHCDCHSDWKKDADALVVVCKMSVKLGVGTVALEKVLVELPLLLLRLDHEAHTY